VGFELVGFWLVIQCIKFIFSIVFVVFLMQALKNNILNACMIVLAIM